MNYYFKHIKLKGRKTFNRENFFPLNRDSNSVITYEEGTYPETEVVHTEREIIEKEGERMWAPVVSYSDEEEEHHVH